MSCKASTGISILFYITPTAFNLLKTMIMKRILLLSMTLLFTVWGAHAATDYGFKIGGVSVTSDNCNNVTGSNISGSVVYNPSTSTVTLTNVTISRTGSDNRAIYNNGRPGLIVVLKGTCNLSAADAAPVRLERNTTITVPAGSTATITGGSEGGVYITNSSNVAFNGYGNINITATSKGGIEGNNSNNNLSFGEGINASIKGGGGDLLDIWRVAFAESSNVTLKATNSSSNPNLKNVQSVSFLDGQTILAPMGATYSSSAKSIVLNGTNVYSNDIFISSNYVAQIKSSNFPDDNFRNYLLVLFPKGYITATDVANTTSLNVSGKAISSLTGVAYFTELTYLNCNSNSLSTLNLDSRNSKLLTLNCNNNNLSSLYLNDLTKLTTLDCSGNKLYSLGLTNNTALTTLYCNNNRFTTLHLQNNTSLKTLVCYFNFINGNGAETFVANLPQRSTPGTIRFIVTNGVNTTEYNHLLKQQVQTVHDKNWNIQYTAVSAGNPWLEYTGEVLLNETNFPDDTFRNLVGGIDSDNDGYLTDQELSITTLNVNHRGISSLQGIEYFTKLNSLYCVNNNLTTIDLSHNHLLQTLNCYNNKISDAQSFVDNLPMVSSGQLLFKFGDSDTNVMTAAQAQTVKGKNWNLKWNDGVDWVPYNGISEGVLGDVTGDEIVDVEDVNAAINIILKTMSPSDYNGNADITGENGSPDGVVDVSDMNAIINIILKQQ